MKDQKPKLQLKKRTIANLSNLEMNYVHGGDGDDEGVSFIVCGQDDIKKMVETTKSDKNGLTEAQKKKILLPSLIIC